MSQNFNVKNDENEKVTSQLYRTYGTSSGNEGNYKHNSVDFLQATIGDFGRWQCQISILMSLLKLPIAWFQLGIVFLAPPTEFWCKPPENYQYMSTEQWKNFIAPKSPKCGKHHSPLESGCCWMWDIENSPEDKTSVVPCRWGYEYNRTVVNSNIITEWNLVCGRERLVDVAQITLMFGVLLGSLIFGIAADKFGRRKILLISICMQSFCGILSALSPWYSLFLVFRLLLALANGGSMITSFVMCMEIVGGPYRTIVPILYQIPFGLGNSIMAGIAYFLRDWRELQFTLSALSALYISYFFLIPESPRWLMAVGRTDEAVKILEKAATTNGVEKSLIVTTLEDSGYYKQTREKPKLGTILKTSTLRKRTILLCLNWAICGISFYGFSQYLGQISHNLYFAVAVGGFIAVPGTFLCVFVVKRCGRRYSIACANFFTAFCFLSILIIPRGHFRQDWPRVILAGLGVVGLSVSLPALYLFTGELYPTILRNAGVGCSVMFSKLGSMIAPLVLATAEISWFIPLLTLGTLSIIEGLLVFPLPETLNTNLPETVEDLEVSDNSSLSKNLESEVDAVITEK